MAKPLINASMTTLRNQMANGAPSSPGTGALQDMNLAGGAGAGIGGSGPNLGSSPPVMSSLPTLSSVRSHSLALGGLQHALKVHSKHSAMIHSMMAESRAHIASYNGGGQGSAPKAPKFGSLGGNSTMPTIGGFKSKF